MARPLLLDVDTGVDDAMAIALASRLDEHQLVALTTVAGNVPLGVATRNTLRVMDWMGMDVPVYAGMSAPLVRPLHTAREHHGDDGLGGWDAPQPRSVPRDEHAPEAIVRLAREHQGEITFVFVGPLTNLAVALNLEPRLAEWVHRLVIMGGAFFNRGNVTPHAEFNIFVDPEAAAQVANAISATWVGLDTTHQTGLTRTAWDALQDGDDVGVVLAREVTRRTLVELARPQSHLHDPLAVAVAEDEATVTTVKGRVVIDTGEHRRGETRMATAADGDLVSRVAREVDRGKFDAQFARILKPRQRVSKTQVVDSAG